MVSRDSDKGVGQTSVVLPPKAPNGLRCLYDELRDHTADEIKTALMDMGYLDLEDVGPCLVLAWQEGGKDPE